MRHIYSLTDQTFKILSANVKRIAYEWDLRESYLYQILSGAATDPFAPFRQMFRSVVRTGGDVSLWMIELQFIANEGKSCEANPVECLLKKIHIDSETTANLVSALKDGELDERECQQLLADIETRKSTDNVLETYAQFRLSVIEAEKLTKRKTLRVA